MFPILNRRTGEVKKIIAFILHRCYDALMASKRVTAVVDVKTWKKLKEFAKQRGMLRSELRREGGGVKYAAPAYLTTSPAEQWLRRTMIWTIGVMILALAATTLYAATRRPLALPMPMIAAIHPPPPSTPAEWIVVYANEDGVPWQAAYALAMEESRMNPRAVGHDRNGNSYGIMQLNERWFSDAKAGGVEANVSMGVLYFAKMRNGCLDRVARTFSLQRSSLTEPVISMFLEPWLSGCAIDRYRGKRK